MTLALHRRAASSRRTNRSSKMAFTAIHRSRTRSPARRSLSAWCGSHRRSCRGASRGGASSQRPRSSARPSPSDPSTSSCAPGRPTASCAEVAAMAGPPSVARSTAAGTRVRREASSGAGGRPTTRPIAVVRPGTSSTATHRVRPRVAAVARADRATTDARVATSSATANVIRRSAAMAPSSAGLRPAHRRGSTRPLVHRRAPPTTRTVNHGAPCLTTDCAKPPPPPPPPPSAIAREYAALGGSSGILGPIVQGEKAVSDHRGRYAIYRHGRIYWTPTTGAHEVHGSILTVFSRGRRTPRRARLPHRRHAILIRQAQPVLQLRARSRLLLERRHLRDPRADLRQARDGGRGTRVPGLPHLECPDVIGQAEPLCELRGRSHL